MPFLRLNDKYALLAFEQMAIAPGVTFPIVLTDRVRIVDQLPVVPAQHWKEWLGTILWESVEERCTLFVIVREPNDQPGVLNHKNLRAEMVAFLHGLAFTGWPYSASVHMLCGNVNADGPDIRQHSEPVDFKVDMTLQPPPLDEAKLRQVFDMSQHVIAFHAGGWHRVKRGSRALVDALKMDFSEDRLHLFVRAMDAVVKTPQNAGRVTFAQRCNSTFLSPHADNERSLEDMYFLRNAVEHVKDIEVEPTRIVDPAQRKAVRERRLRQLEVLAMAVYRRIIGDPVLRADLSTDAGIDAFWAMPDADRAARWNAPVDLNAIP